MSDQVIGSRRSLGVWLRIAGWGAAAGLLLLPLVAMQFTDEVNWTGSDFVFAAVMLGSVGAGLELVFRLSRQPAYRAATAIALGNAFLITWVNGAAGILGSERDPINTVFTAIVALALLGALVARFRAGGMAIAMAAAGIAQTAALLVGLGHDLRGAVLSSVFVVLWFVSARLFRSARQQAAG